MKIAIGCDHAGVAMKNEIIPVLDGLKIEWEDFGTKDEESVDYPDFGEKVSSAVSTGKVDRGILICGTGIGMSIVANKFPGVRAALCQEDYSAKMSRLHNNANMLVLPGRVIEIGTAIDIVKTWFTTDFEGGRHQKRLDKITAIEKKLKLK
ncbi:MAG TPA: ribose 5-phosphate isomerase B [Nitrospirae bacterium]|nr:ribose-5-phosphate isomerase B [bacterium BMS3Abin09]GBE41589.1 ribose-5-phosphate isomerase B [bacterium BMS3Bbin09]HDH34458.1 ribose 5-phosphate isomerase B [Nitrospirota bacterium]HDO67080.1 ribose 5-phosphate isomerase B [Nitrospirota bacterium]HDZ84158.1 ribose 5-phosphate isomerase B [Nitrospirota bacterium]